MLRFSDHDLALSFCCVFNLAKVLDSIRKLKQEKEHDVKNFKSEITHLKGEKDLASKVRSFV